MNDATIIAAYATNPQEVTRRIKLAIGDCARFIAKEGSRDATLRPADMQQHLDFCIRRKSEMETLLAELQA